jgi:hypothetical protein
MEDTQQAQELYIICSFITLQQFISKPTTYLTEADLATFLLKLTGMEEVGRET